jgi:hypothetical protein
MINGPPEPDVDALPAQSCAVIDPPPALTVTDVPLPAENVGQVPLTCGRLGGIVVPLSPPELPVELPLDPVDPLDPELELDDVDVPLDPP